MVGERKISEVVSKLQGSEVLEEKGVGGEVGLFMLLDVDVLRILRFFGSWGFETGRRMLKRYIQETTDAPAVEIMKRALDALVKLRAFNMTYQESRDIRAFQGLSRESDPKALQCCLSTASFTLNDLCTSDLGTMQFLRSLTLASAHVLEIANPKGDMSYAYPQIRSVCVGDENGVKFMRVIQVAACPEMFAATDVKGHDHDSFKCLPFNCQVSSNSFQPFSWLPLQGQEIAN